MQTMLMALCKCTLFHSQLNFTFSGQLPSLLFLISILILWWVWSIFYFFIQSFLNDFMLGACHLLQMKWCRSVFYVRCVFQVRIVSKWRFYIFFSPFVQVIDHQQKKITWKNEDKKNGKHTQRRQSMFCMTEWTRVYDRVNKRKIEREIVRKRKTHRRNR